MPGQRAGYHGRMSGVSRRTLLAGTLPTVLLHALLGSLWSTRALAGSVAAELRSWLAQVDARCRDVGEGALSQTAWQQEIERLLEGVALPDLLAAIDFEALEARLAYPDLGVDTEPVRFPGLAREDERLAFHAKLFGLAPGRAVIPHGHRHMASAHLVLGGEFRLRQFERISTEPDAWVVEPAVDEVAGAGHASSISDESLNVHWLVAGAARAWTLDVIVTNLDEGERAFDIQNLDPDNAERLPGGLFRMPTLDVQTALARYGRSDHLG